MSALRYGGFFFGVCAAIAGVAALVGTLIVYFHGGSYASVIAWSEWVVGGILILLVGQSGSTSRMAGESRLVVGGRFVQGSNLPQPQSPLFLIPAGAVVIALGTLIFLER